MNNNGWGNNPFDKFKKGFGMPLKGSQDTFNGFQATDKVQQATREKESTQEGTKINELPQHLFVPNWAESADLRNLVTIAAGTDGNIIDFTCPEGATLFFIGYTIFTDALDFDLIEFKPTVNGRRIFPFHGNPNTFNSTTDSSFKIGLGVSTDFSVLIPCQLQLNPGERLVWDFTNGDAVDVDAGVRMAGYVDTTGTRVNKRPGG